MHARFKCKHPLHTWVSDCYTICAVLYCLHSCLQSMQTLCCISSLLRFTGFDSTGLHPYSSGCAGVLYLCKPFAYSELHNSELWLPAVAWYAYSMDMALPVHSHVARQSVYMADFDPFPANPASIPTSLQPFYDELLREATRVRSALPK